MTQTAHKQNLAQVLARHPYVVVNPERRTMIQAAVDNREAIVAANGALATWTPPESTGRSPQDTYIVRRPESEASIDWDSPNNIPMEPETFDMLLEDALKALGDEAQAVRHGPRAGGRHGLRPAGAGGHRPRADGTVHATTCSGPCRRTSSGASLPGAALRSWWCPTTSWTASRYDGRLRKLPDGKTSNMAVAMDFDRSLGVVFGSAYCGSVKKLMFSVMNYVLPGEGDPAAALLGQRGAGRRHRAPAGTLGHGQDDALGRPAPGAAGRRRALAGATTASPTLSTAATPS